MTNDNSTQSISIGLGSKVTGASDFAIALGTNSHIEDARSATALGLQSGDGGRTSSIGAYSTSLGSKSSAPGEYSVAIGFDAESPNDNEATFGNLNGEELDLNVTGNATIHENLEVKGSVNEQNVRDISYSTGHTVWSSGLSFEEVNRFGTTSGEKVEVERLDVQVKGGGTNSNFEVEAFDVGSNTSLGSTTAGTPINDVGTTSEGGDLTIRVTNSDGSDVTASITVTGHVVE
jgi:hypothetical protein